MSIIVPEIHHRPLPVEVFSRSRGPQGEDLGPVTLRHETEEHRDAFGVEEKKVIS